MIKTLNTQLIPSFAGRKWLKISVNRICAFKFKHKKHPKENHFTHNYFVRNIGVLLIILITPPVAIIFWYTDQNLSGSFSLLFRFFGEKGFFQGLYEIWVPVFWGSGTAWSIIGIFAFTEIVLMKVLPGNTVKRPVTPGGYTPPLQKQRIRFIYSITFSFLAYGFSNRAVQFFDYLYDHFGEILGALNIFSMVLRIKGRCCPTTPNSGTTGSFLFDYYWGTDLYSHIFGINVKHFANCRFGMMSWLLLFSYLLSRLNNMRYTGL